MFCDVFSFPSGASCSKLTMLLVNDLLKFQMAIIQIHCYFPSGVYVEAFNLIVSIPGPSILTVL